MNVIENLERNISISRSRNMSDYCAASKTAKSYGGPLQMVVKHGEEVRKKTRIQDGSAALGLISVQILMDLDKAGNKYFGKDCWKEIKQEAVFASLMTTLTSI